MGTATLLKFGIRLDSITLIYMYNCFSSQQLSKTKLLIDTVFYTFT